MSRSRLWPALGVATALHALSIYWIHDGRAPVVEKTDRDVEAGETLVELLAWPEARSRDAVQGRGSSGTGSWEGQRSAERNTEIASGRVSAHKDGTYPSASHPSRATDPNAMAAGDRNGAAATDRGDHAVASSELPSVTSSDAERETDTTMDDDTPRLTLAQVGYGARSHHVLPDAPFRDATRNAEDHLEKNLQQAAMALDHQRSSGIEGPVQVALNGAAWGHVPPRSKARLSVVIDGDGRVSAIDVLETNDGMAEWRAMSQQALAKLQTKKIRVPEGRRVELVFEVESKVLMPSGAKPRRGVSLLGVPLGQQDPTQEPAVKILDPHFDVEKVEIPKLGTEDENIELPLLRVGIELLSIPQDPVDWVAPAQQVVHSKLVGQRVL